MALFRSKVVSISLLNTFIVNMLYGFESFLFKRKVFCGCGGSKGATWERATYPMLNRASLKGLLRFDWGIKEKEFAV